MSNKALAKKQEIYKDDTLRINNGLLTVDRWDSARINQRTQELILRAASAFISPFTKQEVSALGFFDSSKDALDDVANDDLDDDAAN
ncbi:DUF1524 domain-containing protein [Curtobacterium flaccumfaciens]|nr:DUF1524 domain-containing protein [Curtobacterium flaccumfaciens]